MVEACQKLIMFAAALSAKDDAVLKLPVDMANLQNDDGQAYEHHRLRLHRLVDEAMLKISSPTPCVEWGNLPAVR